MKRITKIAVAAGAALSLGLAALTASASPYGYGPGWGGHMGGYAAGYGMGPGMMGGYGPGDGMGYGMHGYGPGYSMGYGMHGHGMGYGMGPQAMFGGYYGNVDENLASLKARLGITGEQAGAWQAFVDSAKQQGEKRQAWFARMQQARSASSAPELLALQTEWMKQRQTELEASAAALNSLYAALTPEQKQIADQGFGGYGWGRRAR